MTIFNYAQREVTYKIVYYGPALGGKTTNIQKVHQSVPKTNIGDLISLSTYADRTLFFDYTPLDIGLVNGFKVKFQLYTVPGQTYYNSTRKLVLRGVDGVIFVADSQREKLIENIESFENLKMNLKEYSLSLDTLPYIIQYNKQDLEDILPIEELQRSLNKNNVPYYTGIAVNSVGVKQTLKGIISLVIKDLPSAIQHTEEYYPQEKAINDISKTAAQEISTIVEKKQEEITKRISIKEEELKKEIKQQESVKKDVPIRPYVRPSSSSSQLLPHPITQQAIILYKGIRVGSAELTLSSRSNIDSKGAYQLLGMQKYFLIFNKFWIKMLEYKKEPDKEADDPDKEYLEFEDKSSKKNRIKRFLLKKSDNGFYLSYNTGLGEIIICPKGCSEFEYIIINEQ